MSSLVFLRKLSRGYIWRRIFHERLTEPVHLNAISTLVAMFGTFRSKVAFDLVIRHQHAFALLSVADSAKALGYERTTVIEFGVAAGAGLLNLQKIAERVTRQTGVAFDIYGFDTGEGMPPPQSHKDHPELYQAGDYAMDFPRLSERLESNTKLLLGPLSTTVGEFAANDFSSSPIGFISIDVDYYSSTVDALRVLELSPENLLPTVTVYVDDLEELSHNSRCGEQAAILEFNERNSMRLIERHAFLRSRRVFKNARWIDHMFYCHILDHHRRNGLEPRRDRSNLANPYLH